MSKVGLFWNDPTAEEQCNKREETDASAEKTTFVRGAESCTMGEYFSWPRIFQAAIY
jgi:hypothetical protein